MQNAPQSNGGSRETSGRHSFRRRTGWTSNPAPWATIQVVLAAALLGGSIGYGQDFFPVQPNNGRTLPTDRELTFALYDATQLLDTERSLEALEALQVLWDHPSDTFLQGGEPLRERLHEVFHGLSRDNLDAYNRRYDGEAARLLEEYAGDGEIAGLELAVRRYYFTSHGLVACQTLAGALIDQGDLIGGARYLEYAAEHPLSLTSRDLLTQAARCWLVVGETERANQIAQQIGLEDVASLAGGTRWVPHPESTDWHSFRQSPLTQSSRAAPVSPLGEVAWTSPTIEHDVIFFPGRTEEVQQILAGFVRRVLSETERELVPVLQPVAVGKLVIFNSYSNTWAVDAETGELMWLSIDVDKSFGQLFVGSDYEPDRPDFLPLAELFFGQQCWRDRTKGTLSTDGERVFVIRDGGMVAGDPLHANNTVNNRHAWMPGDFNRLMAFTADEGELLWGAGGERDGVLAPFSPESQLVEAGKLEGLFFLGPPLPFDGRLYCLAEDRGEVGLYVLDAASGSPLWTLPIAQPYQGVSYDHDRRWAGLTPVLSGQILVCPTGDGTLIGVDIVSRAIQWVAEYSSPSPAYPSDANPWRFAGQGPPSLSLDRMLTRDRWLDSVPLIDGRHVLFTPFDDKELYCFDLVDGTILWVRPRGQSWFIGGVHEGKALLVGQDGIHAVDVATGEDAWDAPVLLPAPAGRGVQSAGTFHLPLSTDEIVSVDIATGRILARSPLSEEGVAGNMIALGDRLIMVTPLELVGLSSLIEVEDRIAAELASDPESISAMRMRGELRLHQNQPEQGMLDLAMPVAEGDPLARNLLAHQIAEGLRTDFEAYRDRASEVVDLIDDPNHMREFSKVYVAALESHGESVVAFEQLLDLAGQPQPEVEELLPDGRRVRADRWLTAWLSRIYREADEDDRPLLDARLAEMIAVTDSPRMLRDIAPLLADASIRNQVISRAGDFADPSDALIRERLLLEALQIAQMADDGDASAAAKVQLLNLYADLRNPDGLTWIDEQLGPLAGTESPQSISVGDALAAVRADPEVEQLLGRTVWPAGEMVIKEQPDNNSPTAFVPIPVIGHAHGPLDGWTFLLEPNLRNLYAKDAKGVLRWAVPSSLSGGNAAQSARYVEIRGSHVLCVFADRLLLIDALSQPEGRVITSESLIPEDQGAGGRATLVRGQTAFRFRGPLAFDQNNLAAGNVGPMTSHTVCFQQGDQLIGLDPMTGERVWQRGELPAGCELIGDEEYLLVKPMQPQDSDFFVFRMQDGESLGTWPMPDLGSLAEPEELVDWGRCWLTEKEVLGDGFRLAMHDFIEERDRWSVNLPENSHWTTIDGTDIVTLTPDGTLTVIDHLTGETLHSLNVSLADEWEKFSLRRHSEGWLLLGQRRRQGSTRLSPPGLLGNEVNGEVALIDPEFREVVWVTDVKLQVYPSWQPIDWPMLVFACRRNGPRLMGDGNLSTSDYFAMQVLDVRTGDLLYETEVGVPQIQPVWDADPDEARITIRFHTLLIEATFPSETSGEQGAGEEVESTDAPPQQPHEPSDAPPQ